MNLVEKFMLEVGYCETLEFIGLAQMLSVPLINEDKEPREFADVFENILANYSKLNRARKKELLKVLKDANRTKNQKNKIAKSK